MKIRSYRIYELHDEKEQLLLSLNPTSDEAKRLRAEIEQQKHIDPDLPLELERREVDTMAAQLQAQGRQIGDVRAPRDTRWQRRKEQGA